ncbi:MAG: hypothetical protein H9802_15825 [Candidatus Phocaeicola faecipullorum]|nr:hypothetical protein [Candidatus Phocaeicola faecipullorum]
MRRNYYLLFTVFAFLAFFSYSCVDEDFFSTTHRHEFNDFSLEEAKTYFRERSENQLSRSDGNDENLPLSPGDFVPLWDGAVPSVMNGLACYDIPISETSSYHAIISEEHNGAITARQVKVYQKLVILKDLNDGMMSQYILSLIPSKSYELQKGKQIPELFTTRGDKGGFSGIAIYSCLYTGVTARVDTYNKGRKVNGVFLLDAKNHEELNIKIETAKEQLCMLSLQKRKKVLSRGEYTYNEDTGYFEVETDDLIVYPDDWAGADGMTNAEWVESTRPDGNVDPQPEPEPELPEEDYSQAEEEKDKAPGIVETIFNRIDLNKEQLHLLENALTQIKSSDLGVKMYECLSHNFNIAVKMDSNLKYDAIYNKGDKCVYFKENSTIKGDNLIEELIHAVQHYTYGDNMTTKNNNFEFEAKVLQDWDCIFNKEGGCGYKGEIGVNDESWCSKYENLIYTENWNSETFNLYNELGLTWGQYEGVFDTNILPEVIIQYFENRNEKDK